jgi:RimJ/RimL family protein N-acetyltransferase
MAGRLPLTSDATGDIVEPPFHPSSVVLEGEHVRLEPLSRSHAPDLAEAGRDPSIWTWMPWRPLASPGDALAYVDAALAAARDGGQVPFATISRASGRVVGSTRYLDVRREHRGLEIGWTWIAPEHQRTAVNTEAKRLMLAHAFEEHGALRVQLKTDALNLRSQRAIERLGAVREGTLRATWSASTARCATP